MDRNVSILLDIFILVLGGIALSICLYGIWGAYREYRKGGAARWIIVFALLAGMCIVATLVALPAS